MLHRLRRKLVQCFTWPLYFALGTADWLAARRKKSPQPPPAQNPFRPGISIIIPERANPALLAECLKCLRLACDSLAEPYEVIVIASETGPSSYNSLVCGHRSVRWLFSKQPLRFSAAIRQGLALAQYDWIYLLNNDMVLEPAALSTLLLWRSQSVFAIASQIFFQDPAKRREETGWTVFASSSGPVEILDQVPEDDCTVRGTFYAGGGAALFRRDLLIAFSKDSSVYDPFYWEDAEWGTRAWWSGYQVLFCPASRVWHAHRATNRKFFSEQEIDRIQQRNRLVFHLRNGPSVASLAEFDRLISPFPWRSLLEIMSPARLTRIALARWRNTAYPFRNLALEYTWRKYYPESAEVNSAKPCVLVVTPYALFPPSHGGARRIHALLEILSDKFSIVLLSDEADLYTSASIPYFKKLASVHLVGGRSEDAHPNHRTGRIVSHSHPSLAGHLRFLLASQQPAIVQIEYVELMKLVEEREDDACRWFLTEHDVLMSADGGEAAHDANELQWLSHYDGVIACSPEDARLVPHRNVLTIPNGASLDGVYKLSPQRAPILFLGPFRYAPNLRGILDFLEQCWQPLRLAVPWAELCILGGQDAPRIASEMRCFHQEGIRVMPYVDDPRKWLDNCALTINPLHNVRGSCLKVIESLAAGRICVSTRDGARGFLDSDFKSLIVPASVAEFVEPLSRLLVDDVFRRSLEPPSLLDLTQLSWRHAAELQAGVYKRCAPQGRVS